MCSAELNLLTDLYGSANPVRNALLDNIKTNPFPSRMIVLDKP
jgi:hypothetical protein